jgi:lysozyme
MTYSKDCINLVKEFEGLYLKAYLCPAGVPTIGYGSIRWPDGKKVQLGEVISLDGAESLLKFELDGIIKKLPKEVKYKQSQLDAVASFIYNLGMANYLNSTLYKKIKNNTSDTTIPDEFRKWVKARVNGKLVTLKGLVRRREAEIKLYLKDND